MQINLTSKHLELTDAIRKHIDEKLSKLPRYYSSISQSDVIIEGNEGGNKSVEIIVRAEHSHIFIAKETGTDLYTCIDMAVHKVERQIHAHKEKERDNKN